jgi:membrane protein implicated in regulation of membrane protease activity
VRPMWLTWEMWGISALILLGGEVWSQNFVFLWPALAAAATSIGALLGLSENAQLTLFSILSIVLLALSRTVLRKALFPEHKRLRTNVDAIPGSLVEVVEPVGDSEHPGTVKLSGEVWSAYVHGGKTLSPGQQGRVLKVEGLKLVVEPKEP